ncbi:hypothetical protein V1477_001257 [Vespula maculifrons]|uniref:Uncharacterized protein n=1 Tax=Vespula maculifrons TaxID=7453 RepID=A0ABD2CZF2_VESMC
MNLILFKETKTEGFGIYPFNKFGTLISVWGLRFLESALPSAIREEDVGSFVPNKPDEASLGEMNKGKQYRRSEKKKKKANASRRESRNNKAKHQGRQALLRQHQQRLGPIQREEALIERLLNPLSRVGWLSKFESRGMPPPVWLRPANRRPVPACHLAGYPGTSMLSHADTNTVLYRSPGNFPRDNSDKIENLM